MRGSQECIKTTLILQSTLESLHPTTKSKRPTDDTGVRSEEKCKKKKKKPLKGSEFTSKKVIFWSHVSYSKVHKSLRMNFCRTPIQ